MINARQRTIDYFGTTLEDSWRWSEDGVLTWADGTTVAFREELAEILSPLAAAGLPPFDGVALLLAACRAKFPQPSLLPTPSSHAKAPKQLSLLAWRDPANQEFSELLARLRSVSELPAELRNNLKSKSLLLETVFGSHEPRFQPGIEIITLFRSDPVLIAQLNGSKLIRDSGVSTFRFISQRLAALSPEALALRMRTGLEALPQEADLDIPPAERARRLLDQLKNDPEYQGFARVAQEVMAAIYLPRPLSEPEELALGGFSDIANRGNLDRLLPSELANDDLTLATRVALNEALYLRREPPAHFPPGEMAILLDAGIRMWGLPRVFAAAVGLALVAKENRRGGVSTWRASATGIEPVDLTLRSGLTAHLEALECCAHPGLALKPFIEKAGGPDLEAVLITTEDSLDDRGLQERLRDLECARLHIATVARDGSFRMFLYPRRNTPLCEATISLDEVFPSAGGAKLRNRARDLDFPLIISSPRFPFLMPVLGKIERSIRLGDVGGIAIMQDRRLLRWLSLNRGATMLAEGLPRGRVAWLGTSHGGARVHALIDRPKYSAQLATWDAETAELRVRDIGLNASHILFARNDILYAIDNNEWAACELQSGRVVAHPRPNSDLSPSARYARDSQGRWWILRFDGQRVVCDVISVPVKLKEGRIMVLIDYEGSDGPWALSTRGEIFNSAGQRVINLGREINSVVMAEDGRRIAVNGLKGNREGQLIDLTTCKCDYLPSRVAEIRLSQGPLPTGPNLRIRIESICLSSDGVLRLRDARSRWWQLGASSRDELYITAAPADADRHGTANFEPVNPAPDGHTYLWKSARLSGGQRAWLDARGLVHLRGADPSSVEISVVLSENHAAAWSSDGEMSGNPFLVPDAAKKIPASAMLAKIRGLCGVS